MNDYKYTPEQLYEATDNGLQIIHRYLPDSVGCERNKKHFRLRQERTPSASLFKTQECWVVKDFGSGESFNPIAVFQRETGITDFYEALKSLYAEFNVSENSVFYQSNITFSEKGKKPDDYFLIKTKKKIENPNVFSAFVTADLCQKYNVYELEYYEFITNTSKKCMRVESTANYPIFCYSDDLSKWAKIYCPAEKKRTITKEDGTKKTINFKHGYLGKKPEKYYHGLKEVKNKLISLKKLADKKDNPDKEDYKIPYIVICSGGSDGLSLASLSDDFLPVWGNSENDIVDYETYNFLKENSQNLCYLPDTDSSGVNFAYKYSKVYWKLDIVFLPKYYLGEKGKDFRDYVSYFSKKGTSKEIIASEFKKLLAVPVNFDFVSSEEKRYRVNSRNLYYFLNAHNYFVYEGQFLDTTNNEDKGKLIHIDTYKISTPSSKNIRDFCTDFYIRKGTSRKVLDLIDTCNAMRDADLRKVPSKKLDFSKHGKDFQLFFFQNICIKVSPDKIESVKQGDITNYVMESAIKPRECTILNEPFFEYYKDDFGRNRVKILKTDFDYMNFLINGSRVFWKEEAEKNNNFRKITLNSEFLTEEQQIIQEQHFLGKCFAIGYLLHRYNVENFAKFVYILDDEEKGAFLEANGGSGKSLFMKGVEELCKFFDMPAKQQNLLQNTHLFGSLKEEDEIIFFDDMISSTDFTEMYSFITRGLPVNPKNRDSYFLPFEKSPKLAGTFNYALRNTDQSTLRRILFVSFSSYYHFTTKEYEEWQPINDFGGLFFKDWNIASWNLFYNFMFRCLQLYLQNRNTPLLSPMDNISKNNLKAAMGDNFFEWADVYFDEDKLNVDLDRIFLQDDYKNSQGNYKLTSKAFKTKLMQFCQLKGYIFNPIELCNKDGHIKKMVTIDFKRKSREYFHIKTQKDNEVPKQNKPENASEPDNLLDDIAF